MAIAEDDIQYLIQIVKKDREIQEKKKFLEEAPERQRRLEKQIAAIEQQIEETKTEFTKLEKERRELESEIKDQNDKITEKKVEQTKVNDNKAYRALTHEIEYLTNLIDREEERMLAILEKTEGRKTEVDASVEKGERERLTLKRDREAIESQIAIARDELQVLQDEKRRVLPHLSVKIRNLYSRILNVKGDSGVANLVDNVCQGCYSYVPLQKAHEIRMNNQILTCEVCGRILVYYPVDETNR
jgi:predicted  nucleic acid-binding Zn-ribbon protein